MRPITRPEAGPDFELRRRRREPAARFPRPHERVARLQVQHDRLRWRLVGRVVGGRADRVEGMRGDSTTSRRRRRTAGTAERRREYRRQHGGHEARVRSSQAKAQCGYCSEGSGETPISQRCAHEQRTARKAPARRPCAIASLTGRAAAHRESGARGAALHRDPVGHRPDQEPPNSSTSARVPLASRCASAQSLTAAASGAGRSP